MAPDLGISKLESKVFKSYWQDGALDVTAGLALTAVGVLWLTGPLVAQTLAPAIAFVLYPILRKKVTEPRLGHVRFAARRRSRLRLLHWMAFVLGLLVLVLGLAGYWLAKDTSGDTPVGKALMPGLPAALVALMAIIGSVMLGAARFLAYAALLIAGGAVVVLLKAEPGWALLAGGFAVLANGVLMMIRFVRDFPIAASALT